MSKTLNRLFSVMAFSAMMLSLNACSPYWDAMPTYGEAVNGAIVAHSKNPDAPKGNPKAVAGLDGPAAKNSVDSYQKSFIRTQPATTSTGSLTGGSAGVSIQN